MEVDNAICELDYKTLCLDNVKRSLQFNTRSIVSCIRMFKELGIKAKQMTTEGLNIDQQYLVELYKIIDEKECSSFTFDRVKSKDVIERVIDEAIKYRKKDVDLSVIASTRKVLPSSPAHQ